MHIRDLLDARATVFSFEFFPPATAAAAGQLYDTIAGLEPLQPTFVSVTYGAGGSTRQLTHDLVVRIKTTTQIETVPHLTCVCHGEREIDEILERYARAGVGNVLALAGDPPRSMPGYDRSPDAFRHAADLVGFIRRFNDAGRHPDPRGFGVGVAGFPEGHPATRNRLLEMDYFKAKIDAGADYVCTQLFFDNRDFYDFRERCVMAGIKVPIVAGIMPVTSLSGMKRMADLAAGSRFPAPLLRAVERAAGRAHTEAGREESVKRVGIHWATEQCRDLLDHEAAGIHFYTLNRSDATRRIYETLGLRGSMLPQPRR
jgi:methylenetetrahydrofolate reductase (NADPH)